MGKRILVADDSLTVQRAFTMVLAGSEYELAFAKTVEESLIAVKRGQRPDLLLADIALGSGSGYDLCSAMKADPLLRSIPVYILASPQTPYDEDLGRKANADGVLIKPFDSQVLLDSLSSAIATPVKSALAADPGPAIDLDNTTRFSPSDVGPFPPAASTDDDDDYGEIVIERGAAPAQSPMQNTWAGRGAAPRPSASIPAVPSAPSFPAPAPRPSLIPGAKPMSAPPARPTAPPIPVAPSGSAPKPSLNRTIMGFPSVKPPMAQPSVASPPAAAPPATPPQPSRPTISPPVLRPSATLSAQPFSLAAPSSVSPTAPTPAPPTAPGQPRPVPPRFTSSALAPPSVEGQSQVTRRVPTPVPPSVSSVVSSAVDRKMAALESRGPEYAAIAKLSREIIEQVVWEVVPELAEMIIRQEIDRLASAKK